VSDSDDVVKPDEIQKAQKEIEERVRQVTVNIAVDKLQILNKIEGAAALEIVSPGYIARSLSIVEKRNEHRIKVETSRHEMESAQAKQDMDVQEKLMGRYLSTVRTSAYSQILIGIAGIAAVFAGKDTAGIALCSLALSPAILTQLKELFSAARKSK
jgi:hypothetical protein